MRVAIVNDMALAAEGLRRVISALSGYSVAWIARNGLEAVDKCAQDTPDLILMDLVMPVMNGVAATRLIMERTPCAILVVAAAVGSDSREVFDALSAGALDAVQTPTISAGGIPSDTERLTAKLKTIGRLVVESNSRNPLGKLKKNTALSGSPNVPLVVIGASAGGPAALSTILSELPSDFPAAIVIIQHIDAQFAPSMASWLDKNSALAIRIAVERDTVKPGAALLASTNDHLVFLDPRYLGYKAQPRDCHYRPSIDVFFESVVTHWKGEVVAVLLTGMGRDGAKGLKSLRDGGVLTIAQNADSCVVYGMPKAAAELNAAVEILPLNRMASRLIDVLKSERQGAWR